MKRDSPVPRPRAGSNRAAPGWCDAGILPGAPRPGMLGPMTRAALSTLCRTLPGAEVSDPWGGGHDAWKVGGKMFACVGALDQGVAVKTADPGFAALLIESGDAERARYFHRSWVLIPWGADEGFLRDRVTISYDLIRAKLPKRLREALPPRPQG